MYEQREVTIIPNVQKGRLILREAEERKRLMRISLAVLDVSC